MRFPMSGTVPNEQLRQHVTRVGFDLTLGKTHVAALVMLDVSIRSKQWMSSRGPMFRMLVPALHGLEDRGLVVHHYDDRYSSRGRLHAKDEPRRHFTITKAGRLVIGLLKESGVWDEYAAYLPGALVAVADAS